MPTMGRWRKHKGQKMGSISRPGPGVDALAVCIVEAPERQERTQQDVVSYSVHFTLLILLLRAKVNDQISWACRRMWVRVQVTAHVFLFFFFFFLFHYYYHSAISSLI